MKKHIILYTLTISVVLSFMGCSDKKQVQDYTKKLESVSKSINDKDFNSAEKQLDELLKSDIKDNEIKDKVQIIKNKFITEKEKADNITKVTSIKELVSKGDVVTANKEIETLVANNIEDEEIRKMIDEIKISLNAKQEEIKKLKAEEDRKKQDETKKKEKAQQEQESSINGIRPLGELRKKIAESSGYICEYIVLTDEVLNYSRDNLEEKLRKYGNYLLIGIASHGFSDPDDTIIKPNMIINNKLAYSICQTESGTYLSMGNSHSIKYLSVDGHGYSYSEISEAIKNHKAFFVDDGSELSTIDSHLADCNNVIFD